MIASINPSTGETLRIFDPLTGAQIDDKLARADRAWHAYRSTPLAEDRKSVV